MFYLEYDSVLKVPNKYGNAAGKMIFIGETRIKELLAWNLYVGPTGHGPHSGIRRFHPSPSFSQDTLVHTPNEGLVQEGPPMIRMLGL